jgi:hypothetical protein
MRIHVTSDWHTDIAFNEWTPPPVDADVVVHLGDLRSPGELSMEEYRAAYPDRENLIAVLGNHDFYSEGNPKKVAADPRLKTTWEEQRIRAAEAAKKHGIMLLDDGFCVIQDVRFIGATLWTDMMTRPPYLSQSEAVRMASRMNDYRLGKRGAGAATIRSSRARPSKLSRSRARSSKRRWRVLSPARPWSAPTTEFRVRAFGIPNPWAIWTGAM